MARRNVLGLEIAFELLGKEGNPAVVVTPGGRSSKDSPGVRELGVALAERGKRVLMWDRPNCGMSDVGLEAESEGALTATVLRELVRALHLGPTALFGGSGGARTSLEAAIVEPELFSHLALWWVAGGEVCLTHMAYGYCCEPAMAVNVEGMAGLARCPSWAELFTRNTAARETLLAMNPQHFVQVMRKWMMAYSPTPGSPIPGLSADDLGSVKLPTLILCNSPTDLNHPAEITEQLQRLIPHARLIDPPWPDDEWNRKWAALIDGTATGLFEGWPALADTLFEFTNAPVYAGSPRCE